MELSTDRVHLVHKSRDLGHKSTQTRQNCLQLLFHSRLGCLVTQDPFSEAPERSGGEVGVCCLLPDLIPALSQLGLVVTPPDFLQVSVDMKVLPVFDVQELEPPAQTLPPTVAVKRSALDSLGLQPVVGEAGDITDVLTEQPR